MGFLGVTIDLSCLPYTDKVARPSKHLSWTSRKCQGNQALLPQLYCHQNVRSDTFKSLQINALKFPGTYQAKPHYIRKPRKSFLFYEKINSLQWKVPNLTNRFINDNRCLSQEVGASCQDILAENLLKKKKQKKGHQSIRA